MKTIRREQFTSMVQLKANDDVKESVNGWFVGSSRIIKLHTGEEFAVIFAVSPKTAAMERVDDFLEFAMLHAAVSSWVIAFHKGPQ